VTLRIAKRLIIAFSLIFTILMGITWTSNGAAETSVKLKQAVPKKKPNTKMHALNVVLPNMPIKVKMHFAFNVIKETPTTTTVPPTTTTTTTTTTATAVIPEVTTTTQSVAPLSETNGNSIWGCIIHNESRGDPTAVNSTSGAGGLFQFLPSSWIAYGGGKYASLPEDATVSEQWNIAIYAQSKSGWYPWRGDGCTPVG
jgi:hypothetical protein